MNIRNQGKEIVFGIDSYQYPWEKPDGEGDYDANWLMIKITYSDSDGSQEYTDPCLLTWELCDVIRELEKIINGEESLYVSEFLEPYLKFSFMKVGENIGIGISFVYDTTDGIWKDRRLAESFTVETAKDILEELKMLNKKYPIKESVKK